MDPAKTTEESMQATLTAADSLPGVGGVWVDQSINTADLATHPEAANDPTRTIINVRVTGDLDKTTDALRMLWGGSLCVSRAVRTSAQLSTVQDRVSTLPGMLSSWTDGRAGTVGVSVLYDDGRIQRSLDAAYGTGLVKVTSTLFPYVAR